MTLIQALDLVVARTGHERYRWLCGDDNPDVAQRDAYRRLVLEQAGAAPDTLRVRSVEVTPQAQAVFDRLQQIHACPDFSRPADCGCQFGRCGRSGKPTTYRACETCLNASRGVGSRE